MNKIFKIIALTLFVSALVISCGKTKAGEDGFYNDITTAKEAARKNNQDCLVLVTMAGDDSYSEDFIQNIVKSDDFKKEVSSKYSVILMDFSENSYQKTVVNAEDSKKDQEAAEQYATIMQENAKLASLLNAQKTPSIYLLTKEGYVISELEYTEDIQKYEDFKELLDQEQAAAESIHQKIEATKKGSALEKVAAIDELYTGTNPAYQTFMRDLIEEVIKLDKKNESGVLSKYILAKADIEAGDFYLTGDAKSASDVYIKVCEEEFLSPEHKQQAYYLGAYILTMTGTPDIDAVIGYLNKAIEVNPEGENVPSIQNVIEYLTQAAAMMESDAALGE